MNTVPSSSHRTLAAALAFLLTVATCAAALASPVSLDERQERRLVGMANSAQEGALAALPGMTPAAAAKVIAHRKSGKRIGSAEEFRAIAGLTDPQFAAFAAHFAMRPVKKDEPLVAGDDLGVLPDPSKGAQLQKAGGPKRGVVMAPKGAVPGKTSKQGAGGGTLNLEVTPGYYSILPGYDLSNVPEEKRQVFLDTINKDLCPCGCGHTLAFCLVNDPLCPVVKAKVRKVYQDIVGEPPAPPPASSREQP